YYVNRPQTLNLWSHLYLYTILLPVLWDPRRLALLWKGKRPRLQFFQVPAILLAALLADGVWSSTTTVVARAVNQPVQGAGASQLSGVWLQPALAEHLERLAGYLRAHPARDELVYFTPFSFSMPVVSGVHPMVPVRDPFWEAHTQAALDDLLLRIRATQPPVILFHDITSVPGDIFGGSGPADFYSKVRKTLSPDYRFDGQQAGWNVLVLREGF
ncbi:hypothetical protein, partial [Planktotalea sp.]